MLHEHRLETRTRGLVCGPTLLSLDDPGYVKVSKERRGVSLFLADPRPLPWAPVVVSYKVGIRSRETNEEIWVRPFSTWAEAQFCYLNLCGVEPRYPDRLFTFPCIWHEGELTFYIATVTTYNSTTNNSSADWGSGGTKCPTGVTTVDWVLVGGAASGGRTGGGGGGAGGFQSGTGTSVTPTTNYPVTIGTGGTGRTTNGVGNDGSDSTWNSQTARRGGGGGYNVTANANGGSGTYGSGGGGGYSGVGTGNGGAGTAGQGSSGGNCPNVTGTGGGGGSGGAGGAGVSGTAGNGGSGTASSISGSSLNYSGGGGGGGAAGTLGTGGSSVGGDGTNSGTAGSGTANRGSGGGGAGASGTSGAGSDGVLILSWTAASSTFGFNMPMLGM